MACELDEAVRRRLTDAVEHARSAVDGVKWVARAGMHVTLKFLGEVEDALVDEIVAALEGPLGDVSVFAVSFQGLGCFPSKGAPRVLWVGVSEGAGELISLNGIVETALEPVGFDREKRSFSPHITLGRVRKGVRPRGIGELVNEGRTAAFGRQEVRHASLIQSVLRPDGAVYTPLHKWQLRGQ